MMDDPVFEISRKYLPQLWLYGHKADRTGWIIQARVKLLFKINEVFLAVYLKLKRIDGIPLVFSAFDVLLINVFKRKQTERIII